MIDTKFLLPNAINIILRIHGFMGYCIIQCGGWIPVLQRTMLPLSSAAWCSGTLVSNHHITWHNNQENHVFCFQHC